MTTSLSNTKTSPQALVSVETITPEMAKEMLLRNKNRSLRRGYVAQIAAAIARGEWKVTNDAITFDQYGSLLNGQHRLSAVVLSNMPIQALVLRNASQEAQIAMDVGKNRTYGDHMQITEGVRHSQNLSSFLKLYMGIENAFTGSSKKRPPVTVLELALSLQKTGHSFALYDSKRAALDGILTALTFGRKITYSRKEKERALQLGWTGIAVAVFLTRRASRGTMNDIPIWESGVETGIGLGENDPRLKLRNLRLTMTRSSREINMVRDALVYIKSFNAWIAGERIKMLHAKEDDFFVLPTGTDPFVD